jgi:hypothetical protein
MSPISVSGFNLDVVIENSALGPTYTGYASSFNPGEGTCFYQYGLPGTSYGLPASGIFTSAADGATVFQFQPYTGFNALVLSSDTGLTSGMLTLAAPGLYSRIALLASSASASATSAGTLTINFVDGTSYITTYNAPDWFNNSGYALSGVERISLSTGSTSGAPTNPRFYQTTLDLNALLGADNKPIASFTFGQASFAHSSGIFAVSGEMVIPEPGAFSLLALGALGMGCLRLVRRCG